MYNLLVINGVEFPTPEGSFEVKYKNITNEYEGESGQKTIEVIREDVASISVSYNGLLRSEVDTLHDALAIVNTVKFYKKGVETQVSMKLTNVSTPKKYHKNNLSVWGMSFGLEEL